MLVSELMTRSFPTVAPDANALDVGASLEEQGIGTAIVERDGELLGIVSKETFVSNILKNSEKRMEDLSVADFMEADISSVDAGDHIKKAIELLICQKSFVDALPVRSDGRVTGLVTMSDITRLFSQNMVGEYKVSDLMHFSPITVDDFTPVDEVVGAMTSLSAKRVLVLSGESLSGIITIHDLSLAIFHSIREKGVLDRKSALQARDIMTLDPVCVRSKDDASKAASIMDGQGFGGIPVADPGLEGLISRTDLLKGYEVLFSKENL